MRTVSIHKWSSMNHATLKYYTDGWRDSYERSVSSGEEYLTRYRKEILREFGIIDNDFDYWSIGARFTYPEPLLYIEDDIGNIRYENGSYYSVS